MLRTNQTIAFDAENGTSAATSTNGEQGPPDGVERRRHPRVSLDASSAEEKQAPAYSQDRRKGDRRKSDRRMDSVRSDLSWTVANNASKGGLGARLRGVPGGRFLKQSRILLLGVALLTGGLAAFLVTQRDQPVVPVVAQPVTQIVQEPRTQILVARSGIGVGQRLSATTVAWEDWPENSVRDDYITLVSAPEAIADMSGSVARFEFFPGEPIRSQKLAQSDQGYLSVVLESGMRGVSIAVAPEAASGGFIVPNDRVDVILTRRASFNQVSETILNNVKVLAINSRLGEIGATGAPEDSTDPRAQIFTEEALATLALSSSQAEIIIGATEFGTLSLVLRSISDFSKTDKNEVSATNAAIRLSSPFWTQSSGQTSLR